MFKPRGTAALAGSCLAHQRLHSGRATTNSGPDEVHLRVGHLRGRFELCATDKRRGFADNGNLRGNGLKDMRRREADMRGSFEATSKPGKGLHHPA